MFSSFLAMAMAFFMTVSVRPSELEEDLFERGSGTHLTIGGSGAGVGLLAGRPACRRRRSCPGDHEHPLAGGDPPREDVGREDDGVLAGQRLDQLAHPMIRRGRRPTRWVSSEDQHVRVVEAAPGPSPTRLRCRLGEIADSRARTNLSQFVLTATRSSLPRSRAGRAGPPLISATKLQVGCATSCRCRRAAFGQVAECAALTSSGAPS